LENVSVKELQEQKHPLDPSASAAILYKKGNTSFDFDSQGHWLIITDVTVRLKIYNKEGYKYATVEIPYYDGGSVREEVVFSDAATYNLTDGKVEKTKLAEESKFTDGVGKNKKVQKIVLPNVKEGSVIEYHYVIKSPNINSLPDWYFQYEIPVKAIEYSAYIPHYFIYNRILSPYLPIKEKQESDRITKMYTASQKKYGSSNGALQNEAGGVTYYITKRIYTAENVPALKDESYVDNIKNYRSFVKHELASTIFPNQPEKKYATNWDAVSKSIYEDENFGKEVAFTDYYEKDLNEILKNKQRPEIIATVFDFVKNRMIWNGEYGYDSKAGVKKAYADKTGNVADINLMLLSMLRYAGLNASPILLSTRANGHVSFVNRDQFNYVIVGVEAQNGIVYLDATSKNAMPNILPIRDLNGAGRIIRENLTSAEIDITPVKISKENTMVVAKIGKDGAVTGQIKTQFYDYNAFLYRENDLKLSKEAYREKLDKELGNAGVWNIGVSNGEDFTQPVVESFEFESKSLCEVTGNKITISPMLFYTMKESPFKEEKRAYPVDFVYPNQERYVISIAIPEGYVAESIPQSSHLVFGDNVGSFKFSIAVNQANQIQVVMTREMSVAKISSEDYESLKAFYADVVTKETEKIVLVKK
jgi:hypothetical protein